MRRSLPGVALIAMAIVVPSSADAETRFVAKGGVDSPGCTNPGAPCETVPYAVGQSASGDTIQIGPGIFVGSIETAKTLTFVGAGGGTLDGIPGTTVIRGTPGENFDGATGLELEGGGALRSLRVEGGKGGADTEITGFRGGTGILLSPAASGPISLQLDGVVAVGGDGGPGQLGPGSAGGGIKVSSELGPAALSANESEFAGGSGLGGGIAIEVNGQAAAAELLNSRVLNSEFAGSAVTIFSGAQVTLESVEIKTPNPGVTVDEGSVAIRRSRIQTNSTALTIEATNEAPAEAELVDSVLFSTQSTVAFAYSEGAQSSAKLIAIGSTLVAFGPSGALVVNREEDAGPATATLRNSIARNTPTVPKIVADLRAIRGTIDADFSSFTTVVAEDGGTVPAPGSAANVAGDPLFVDPGKGGLALQGTSPLIDRGDPALAGAGELDLAGSARSLDGNRDCVVAPDIGAYEVTGQGIPCDPAPTISKFGMTNRVFAPKGGKKKSGQASKAVKRGTKFTYTLSESAKVKITIERKKKNKEGQEEQASRR